MNEVQALEEKMLAEMEKNSVATVVLNDIVIIDSNLRTMTIPPTLGVFGVESDDDVKKINSRCQRDIRRI